MPVRIEEVNTSVQVVDPQALLSPAVLAQIVEAVLRQLDARDRESQARGTELDLRSVVEQQRTARGGG
jgi:hypothetical protein